MGDRRRVAVVLAALPAWALTLPAAEAAPPTVCTGRSEVVRLVPGLSMQPSTGTGSTLATGTVHCTGPVEGHRPTGTITTRHFFV